MKPIVWLAGLALVGASCSSHERLEVKQFTVRAADPEWSDELMVRGEIQKRLYGAVSEEERQARRGQYYSARWRVDPAAGPIRVTFQYRQAATGSQVRALVQDIVPQAETGVAEFQIAGEAYQKGGRVLAWRTTLEQGDQLLGEKKSFLWE
ncbi:hypothetical protein [Roseibacillus ishigakijimensis]|uniref:Lipoprotein n=1 Tax=Roseibacillus ishigakijimensis TaxID=454146 RepID=A0A934VMM0_9BACT|nr:hypothetical protein [Roseibacillus ishigakijimensis]MBK1834095.1 hypothetical protein [Roseibacillus ishigakijimensis]